MIDLNFITSVPAVIVLALVFRGFVPFSVRSGTEELRLFSLGMMWMIATFMLRTAYWGVVRNTVLAIDEGLWAHWSEIVAGPDHINGLFNLGFIIGGLYILRGFHAMIPEAERHRWSIFSAPFYPNGACVRRLTQLLFIKWRRR